MAFSMILAIVLLAVAVLCLILILRKTVLNDYQKKADEANDFMKSFWENENKKREGILNAHHSVAHSGIRATCAFVGTYKTRINVASCNDSANDGGTASSGITHYRSCRV